ncbi:uncharacterized protein LOC121420848 [Lytechinus variegatus]|uniref:uncharacterized protein LOC121420848 n=1 Tax=Lytechinus variegatus TaxID=7654 RepID=UPI001BB2AE9C|nr:uncharacterized protein LOC121420848 [Lytechinus variegatus]
MPSAPPDIPMRSLVPVSEDTVRGSGEGLVKSRMNEESDIETDYDLLNHGSPWAVPHVYRETTNGLAEYAQVSRPNTNKQMTPSRHQPQKQIYDSDADDSDYDLLNTCHLTASATVPHVYRETNTGLAEYAVVSKPGDENKGQSLVSHSKAVKIPHKVEAEYAVVDKSEKRNNKRR